MDGNARDGHVAGSRSYDRLGWRRVRRRRALRTLSVPSSCARPTQPSGQVPGGGSSSWSTLLRGVPARHIARPAERRSHTRGAVGSQPRPGEPLRVSLSARIVGAVARKESEDRSRRVRRKHLELPELGARRPARLGRAQREPAGARPGGRPPSARWRWPPDDRSGLEHPRGAGSVWRTLELRPLCVGCCCPRG